MQFDVQRMTELARQSLACQLSAQEDPFFPELTEYVEESLQGHADFTLLQLQLSDSNPTLANYFARVLRMVAAEEVVKALGNIKWRLVLFGVGVLVPPRTHWDLDQWGLAAEVLEAGLQTLWADSAHSVRLMPQPAPLSDLYALSPIQIRESLLELFAEHWSRTYTAPREDTRGGWVPIILPGVAALDPYAAKEFVHKTLTPGAVSEALSSIRHRFESFFEGSPGVPSVVMLPPCNWATVFSTVRLMHLRKVLRDEVRKDGGNWALRAGPRRLELTGFKAKQSYVFEFPEEPLETVSSLVTMAVENFGVRLVP